MTDPWVADYTSRIAPEALKAAGVAGVCRSLSRHTWKTISPAERAELTAAGLPILLNFEDDSRDWMGGPSAGAADATFAAGEALKVGAPLGCVIAGSADFDMTYAEWVAAGRGYATAYSHGLARLGFRSGVYSTIDVLRWCYDLGGFDVFWQSMSTAYSGGRNGQRYEHAHLWQRYRTTVGGTTVDHNDVIQPDWSGEMALEEIVTHSGARNLGTVVSDLWNEEMNEHSGFVPTDVSPRSMRLKRIEQNTIDTLNAVKNGQPVTLSGPVTLSPESVQAVAAAFAEHIKVS